MVGNSPEEFAAWIRVEVKKWAEVVRDGVVVDYVGAVDIVRRLIARAQARRAGRGPRLRHVLQQAAHVVRHQIGALRRFELVAVHEIGMRTVQM